MNAEEELYLKECDCKEIQQLWKKPKVGDCYYDPENKRIECISLTQNEIWYNLERFCKAEGYIFLPSLEQLLDILGERFAGLKPANQGKRFLCIWLKGHIEHQCIDGSYGTSYRIAVIKAVKEVLKEANERR